MTDAPSTKTLVPSNTLTISILNEVAGVIPPDTTDSLLTTLSKGARNTNFRAVQTAVNEIVANGYSANEVLSALYAKVMFDDTLDIGGEAGGGRGGKRKGGDVNLKKMEMAGVFSEADKVLVDGADEHLVLLDLCCRVAEALGK